MSQITKAIEVEASPDTLFHCVVNEWEGVTGTFWSRSAGPRLAPRPRMRDGLRVRCAGGAMGLPGEVELEIRDFEEGSGWVAASTAGPQISWKWTLAALDRETSRLACRFEYTPERLSARLIEWVAGRRLRARTVGRMLESLKIGAEREEALTRLRRRRTRGHPRVLERGEGGSLD